MPHKTWTGEWPMRLLPRTHLRSLWFSLLMTSWPADIAQTTLNCAKTPMKLANCLGNMGQRSEHTWTYHIFSIIHEWVHQTWFLICSNSNGSERTSVVNFRVSFCWCWKFIRENHYAISSLDTSPPSLQRVAFCGLSHPFSTFLTDRSSLSYRFDGQILRRM